MLEVESGGGDCGSPKSGEQDGNGGKLRGGCCD